MTTITLECEIADNRELTLQLPESVRPGRHQLVVVVDEPADEVLDPSRDLARFVGVVQFPEDGVAYQRRIRDEEWR